MNVAYFAGRVISSMVSVSAIMDGIDTDPLALHLLPYRLHRQMLLICIVMHRSLPQLVTFVRGDADRSRMLCVVLQLIARIFTTVETHRDGSLAPEVIRSITRDACALSHAISELSGAPNSFEPLWGYDERKEVMQLFRKARLPKGEKFVGVFHRYRSLYRPTPPL